MGSKSKSPLINHFFFLLKFPFIWWFFSKSRRFIIEILSKYRRFFLDFADLLVITDICRSFWKFCLVDISIPCFDSVIVDMQYINDILLVYMKIFIIDLYIIIKKNKWNEFKEVYKKNIIDLKPISYFLSYFLSIFFLSNLPKTSIA